MRNFWLILSVLWLWTCSGGGDGDNTTGPEEPPIVINLTSLGGQAQKGPFNNGTAINVAELTNTLSPTGRNFSTAITDNTGRFAVANVELESPYVELRANGYYFNEVANEISSGQLTLFALSNLTGKTSLNVNILTHLEKNRMVTLMSGDNPKTFAQAKLQAQEEVLAIFDYSRANVPESELLDISQSGAANAKLLAMSAIIQGDLTVGQMSQLLANMSTDIASDGTLDDTNLRNTLIENSKNLDIAQVRSHLEAHYSSLGVSANIADFETEVNQFLKPPEAQDISVTIAEDTQINITLAGSDPEGESLTYTILEVNNAAIILDGDVANYTPNANFNGTDTFTYYANDGTSDSNIATVTITISAEDDDPNTLDVATTTDEDVAVVVNLSAEEYDGDSYSFGIIDQPSNGAVSLDGVNATYTPNQDYNGTDSFTFEATDDTGRMMNVGTATITINPVNDAPVITTTSLSFSEVGQKWLANVNERDSFSFTVEASDIDGDPLTFQWTTDTIGGGGEPVAGITDGDVDINGSEYTYTALDCFCGTGQFIQDGFSFYVNDNSGSKSNYEYVVFTVDGVNDAPVANDVTSSMDENRINGRYQPVTITLDATDVDSGDDLTYSVVETPTNGTLGSISGNQIIYTPNQDFNGTDSFTYKANDGTVDSNTATVTITVNPVNDAPIVSTGTISTNEDTAATLDLSTLVTDVDGDDLTYILVAEGNDGTAGITDDILTYTPNHDWNGTTTLLYKVNDGTVTSGDAQIVVTVASVNDIPVVSDASVSGEEDATSFVGGSSINGFKFILPEATDIESGSSDDFHNSLEIVTLPTHGKIYSNNNTGDDSPENELSVGSAMNNIEDGNGARIWYVQDTEHWNGTDTFTYKANDGEADSNTATVTITVNAVNDAPTISAGTISTDEDIAATLDLSTLSNDVDGDNLTYFGPVTGPSNGSITIDGSNVTYTPNANFNGTDSFTLRAYDGNESSADAATVTITINPIDDLQTAIDFTASTAEDVSVDITLQYEDIDGDVWPNETYDYLGGISNGSVTMNSAKTIATYTPNSGFFGTDQFKYSTEGGSSVEGTVTITVKEVVGTLKLYPDLTSDYNEWFHDIVYDETTGGFIVAGISIDKNDSGSGGTKEMFHLRQDSSLDGSPQYETISTTLNSWGNPSNTINNSAHQFGISERSLSSNYLLSTRSDYLWLVDSNGGVTYKQLSGTLDSTYRWVDYIIQSYPTSDGGFLVFGTTSKQSNNQARYPVIAKLDASLNVDYFKVLDSHVANTSWTYGAQAQGMVQAGDGDESVYYLVASTSRVGISNSNAIQFYKVEDSGSALSITQHVDLSSSISNSPTSFTSSDDFDTMAYLPGTSSSDAEFVIVTDNNELTRYNIDSSGNAQIKGTFDLNGYRNANYIEIVGASTSFYIVAQTDSGSGSPNINVAKLSDNLSVAWEKTLDITSLSQGDKLGGATSIQFGQSSTGIAITGSTLSSSGDWDGFILLLDDNGSRIY